MRGVPTDIGVVHFVGIGGIGMSGIAEVMRNLGYTVQGSDMNESPTVDRLRKQGISVHIGHEKENVEGAAVQQGFAAGVLHEHFQREGQHVRATGNGVGETCFARKLRVGVNGIVWLLGFWMSSTFNVRRNKP